MTIGAGQAHADDLVEGGHDLHHRPAPYNDPDLAVPPTQGGASQYPRAVGFTAAHGSNFTSGGLNSYEYVVVHTMQGYYAGTISWFQNPDANVSAHYCMRAEDGEITQMVRNEDRAWHVGGINAQAIGIEHEGFIDDTSWYTWVNYVESARLARWLCDTYDIPIDREHIVGHNELPGQTHTDPGPEWNWARYMGLIVDTVPERVVETLVVDREQACTITANADTWVKRTTEASSDLTEGDLCLVSAGDTLRVNYEFPGFEGHRRVLVDVDDACAGTFEDRPAYVFEGHFDGTCTNAPLEGIEVVLDGGQAVHTDAQGRAIFVDVDAGAHEVTASGDMIEDLSVGFEHEIHPGSRIVLVAETMADGGTGEDPTTGVPPSGSTSGDGDGSSSSGDGGGGEVGTSGDEPTPPATTAADDTDGRSLPEGFGEDEGGCSCRSNEPPAWATMLLPALFLFRRRRS